MSKYLKSGNTFKVFNDAELDLHEQLPAATFTVKYDEMNGTYFLEGIEDFTIPAKIYGPPNDQTTRILNTFLDRDAATGVLLTGEKGSGKTLLAKNLSVEGRLRHNLPTIVITEAFYGVNFNEFIQNIGQAAIVIFDEFEKVYDAQKQEQLLTLLDGVYKTQKLFILTCNDHWRIDKNMRNRPGRLFYSLDYVGLDSAFIREYCEDVLNDTTHIDTIVKLGMIFDSFNFDMLQSLVEEMNRYGEEPYDAMEMLNVSPTNCNDVDYEVTLVHRGRLLNSSRIDGTEDGKLCLNPLADISIEFYKEKGGQTTFNFSPEHLEEVDISTGKFVFFNKASKAKLTLKRAVQKYFDIRAF